MNKDKLRSSGSFRWENDINSVETKRDHNNIIPVLELQISNYFPDVSPIGITPSHYSLLAEKLSFSIFLLGDESIHCLFHNSI
jgi:hypothetical protein